MQKNIHSFLSSLKQFCSGATGGKNGKKALNTTKRLIPGRECGECRVCCEDLKIDEEDIQKASGLLCQNYKKGCCGIYETRPQVCRGYYCGWRMLEELDDSWRPDKTGILVQFRRHDIPEDFKDGFGVEFCLLKPENPKTISSIKLAKAVMKYVAADMPVFLKVMGPPGYNSAYNYISDKLRDAAMAGKVHLVQQGLKTIYADLMTVDTGQAGFTTTLKPGVKRQE